MTKPDRLARSTAELLSIEERQREGIAKAKAAGKYKGCTSASTWCRSGN